MTPEAIMLHYLDDLDAKMQTVRSEFARNEANGRSSAEMTDWVRSMERPLLNTASYLETEELRKQAAKTPEASAAESRLQEKVEDRNHALPFED
jgi:3'-5' exoribonuclease